MKQEDLQQYRVPEDELPGLWTNTWRFGDGYNMMDVAERSKWHAIGCWGRDGWDLGSWPLVVVYFKERATGEGITTYYDLAEYCEGDITMYSCPLEEIRNQITDFIAFFHWKYHGVSTFEGYETVDDVPAELLGPYQVAQEVASEC